MSQPSELTKLCSSCKGLGEVPAKTLEALALEEQKTRKIHQEYRQDRAKALRWWMMLSVAALALGGISIGIAYPVMTYERKPGPLQAFINEVSDDCERQQGLARCLCLESAPTRIRNHGMQGDCPVCGELSKQAQSCFRDEAIRAEKLPEKAPGALAPKVP